VNIKERSIRNIAWVVTGLIISSCAGGTSSSQGVGYFYQSVELAGSNNTTHALEKLNQGCEMSHRGACLALGKLNSDKVKKGLSIYQGHTTKNHTEINILKRKDRSLQYYVWEQDGPVLVSADNIKNTVYSFDKNQMAINHLVLNNLKEGKLYRLDVLDSAGEVVDSRKFKTLGTTRALNTAFISCMNEDFRDVQDKMWTQISSDLPDMMFLAGDTVYADPINAKATPEDIMWREFVLSREVLKLYRFDQLVPIYAAWDDHDYGLNNGGKENIYKQEAMRVFLSFFPKGKNVVKGPGVAQSVTVGDQVFIMLDNRSFRDAKSAPSGTHFGHEQERWAIDQIKKSSGAAFLISGDQWLGSYHPYESYEGHHPKSFKMFMNEVGLLNKPVVFISGDRHFSEISKVPTGLYAGRTTYEITSSGLHTRVYAGSFKRHPNPHQLMGIDGQYNYTIVESLFKKDAPSPLKMKVVNYGLEKKVFFSTELEVK
jgi:hypothetical protein